MDIKELLERAAAECEGEFMPPEGGVYSHSYVMARALTRIKELEACNAWEPADFTPVEKAVEVCLKASAPESAARPHLPDPFDEVERSLLPQGWARRCTACGKYLRAREVCDHE